MLASTNSERAFNVIRHAEREIRGQIAEAAAAGAYETVERLSGIARRLAEMTAEATAAPVALPVHSSKTATNTEESPAAKPRAREDRKALRKKQYPRFEKTRDTLIKIGWSKKRRDEYVHKAPKAGIDVVASRVTELGKKGRVFTNEELLPVKMGGGQGELPGYQAYVCLAWLRDIGAVEQHGRVGYSVKGNNVAETVNKSWEALPNSRR
ncbi:MAG: hypothetical protein DYG93_00755 [Leptolyngbya sp. PLA2]|nr:hypothetical protein [Leptolyngbya sp. PL-A2]MCQ3940075.1 hypothetical protein [cyanobacterium CYA1]MCZ7632805.1 hypothetical protein [Phycisphaerales bacterium]MDL1904188.1 hypothetical protein [Synechococcales cyanobacterium CNB]GIK19121.1 MAG: hypothetical protein BroJett004_12850 [Planctomycetota bacterium]